VKFVYTVIRQLNLDKSTSLGAPGWM